MVTIDFNLLIALQTTENLTQIASKLRYSLTEASKMFHLWSTTGLYVFMRTLFCLLPSLSLLPLFPVPGVQELKLIVFLQVRQVLPSPTHVLPFHPLINWLPTLHSLGILGTNQDRMLDELKTKMTNTYTLTREAIPLGYNAFRRFGSYS